MYDLTGNKKTKLFQIQRRNIDSTFEKQRMKIEMPGLLY